jgi:hypothetical protein
MKRYIILPMQEAEIRRMGIPRQPRKKLHKIPSQSMGVQSGAPVITATHGNANRKFTIQAGWT